MLSLHQSCGGHVALTQCGDLIIPSFQPSTLLPLDHLIQSQESKPLYHHVFEATLTQVIIHSFNDLQ